MFQPLLSSKFHRKPGGLADEDLKRLNARVDPDYALFRLEDVTATTLASTFRDVVVHILVYTTLASYVINKSWRDEEYGEARIKRLSPEDQL